MENESYEATLEAAKNIIAELGKPEVSLSDATRLFKEARALLDAAAKQLENAKTEYEELQNS